MIGLTITMDIFVGGGVSGAAMNPARWFGPAIVQGAFDNWWIYWVGPIVGAVLAALLWNEVYLKGLTSPEAGASSVDIEQTQGAPTPAQAQPRLRYAPRGAAASSRCTAAAIASPTAAVVTVFSPGRAVSGVRMPSSIASSMATSTARASRSSRRE